MYTLCVCVCTRVRVSTSSYTCASVCFILDRPGSVFFDQELSSGRKHRYWISLWARVIDLKSL